MKTRNLFKMYKSKDATYITFNLAGMNHLSKWTIAGFYNSGFHNLNYKYSFFYDTEHSSINFYKNEAIH